MRDENSTVVTHSLNISLASDSTSNSHSYQYAISAIYSAYCICDIFNAS